jgi:hypothetical protein
MSLKVVQGLVGSLSNLPPPAEKAAPRETVESLAQSFKGVVAAASVVSAASEAVVTTIRASSRAAQTSELRSPDDAEKLARKVAKNIESSERSDSKGEALEAHSGLDVVSRSGKGSGDLLF